MLMETFSRENGLKGRQMDLVFIDIRMEGYIKEYGSMICKMGEELKNGKMEAAIKGNLKMV